ncbi:MAG: hypothetical protein J1F35_06705 [Erysipelotrichales bacterium]|nr:hypothetical protein [Erysipelotrichales bacterium]
MKTRLTNEQSQHLIDLGVLKEKASGSVSVAPIGDGIRGLVKIPKRPIFRLEDFLNGEILPKEIKTKDGDVYLDIQIMNENYCVNYEYIGRGTVIEYYDSPELIEALYQLTCWYYGEYLKSEEK